MRALISLLPLVALGCVHVAPTTGTPRAPTEFVEVGVLNNVDPILTAPSIAPVTTTPIDSTTCTYAAPPAPAVNQTNPQWLFFHSPFDATPYLDPAAKYCRAPIPAPLPSGVNFRAYVQLYSTQCLDPQGVRYTCPVGPRAHGGALFLSRPAAPTPPTPEPAPLSIVNVITAP